MAACVGAQPVGFGEREVPRAGDTKLAGEDVLDVPPDERIQNAVKGEHEDDYALWYVCSSVCVCVCVCVCCVCVCAYVCQTPN